MFTTQVVSAELQEGRCAVLIKLYEVVVRKTHHIGCLTTIE